MSLDIHAHLLLKSNISLIRYLLVNLSAAETSSDLTSPPLTPTAWALEIKPLACVTQAAEDLVMLQRTSQALLVICCEEGDSPACSPGH